MHSQFTLHQLHYDLPSSDKRHFNNQHIKSIETKNLKLIFGKFSDVSTGKSKETKKPVAAWKQGGVIDLTKSELRTTVTRRVSYRLLPTLW